MEKTIRVPRSWLYNKCKPHEMARSNWESDATIQFDTHHKMALLIGKPKAATNHCPAEKNAGFNSQKTGSKAGRIIVPPSPLGREGFDKVLTCVRICLKRSCNNVHMGAISE
jgi:hypothetical protein